MHDLLQARFGDQLVPVGIACVLHHLEYVQVADPGHTKKKTRSEEPTAEITCFSGFIDSMNDREASFLGRVNAWGWPVSC